MPEGDTIHRAARRINAALEGRELELADAPNPRSPVHGSAKRLQGQTLERAEAIGKHLLVHLSGGDVVHSHLGMNGRWFITTDGRLPYGKPWLRMAAGRSIVSQNGGKILRIVTAARARNDPTLRRLGPDPLRPGFDRAEAAARLLRQGAGSEIGDALLDQSVIAGIGNAIRNEACFVTGISPWRRVEDLDAAQLEAVVEATEQIMAESMRRGRRPRSIYRANRRGGCPRCGKPIRSRGQGDDNRTAYWCPSCQT